LPTDDLKVSETFSDPGTGADPASTSSPAPAESAPASPPAGEQPSTDTSVKTSGDTKETLLDAVLKVVPATPEPDVLAKPEDSATPTAQTAENEDQADKKPDEGEDDTTSDEDDEKAAAEASNPATRKKINKLLRQRRELRDEVSGLRPIAEIGNELQTFARTNDLSGDDIIMSLNIAATLRRGDYDGFYRAVGPYVRRAQEYLGVTLPPDLAEKVQQGQMTETAAKEFARVRYDHQRSEAMVQDAQTAERGAALQAVQADIQRAVSALEGRFAASDPDYKAKADHVRRVAQAMLFERGGAIGSVQDALEITKAAYVEVSKSFRSQRPQPQPTLRTPNGHAQTPSARPEPKTLMEAALQGLADSRRAG
jgi:hypothetical protein